MDSETKKRVPLHLITAASSASYLSCTLKIFIVFLLNVIATITTTTLTCHESTVSVV